MLVVTLAVSLLAAAIPALFGIFELNNLRENIAKINEAVACATEIRVAADKIAQNMVRFTAMALDLPDEERTKIVEETDQYVRDVANSVASIKNFASHFLADQQIEKLDKALNTLNHSWDEIRAQRPDEITSAEKTYHFLQIVDGAKAAREVLVSVEASVAREVDDERQMSFARLTRAGYFVILMALFGTISSIGASIAIYHFATGSRKAYAELEQRDRQLSDQNVQFSTALNNMSQGLCMYDDDNKLVVSNHRWKQIYDLPDEATTPGVTLQRVLEISEGIGNYPNRDLKQVYSAWQALIAQRKAGTFFRCIKGDRIIAVSHVPMEGGGWVTTHEDVTERKKTEALIEYMANHDLLTELPNRTLLRNRTEKALTRLGQGEQLAVLCLDLDNFKNVNDTLGHPVGDALLRAIGDRLRTCLRETDTIARIGGDEFAIVQFPSEQPRQSAAFAQRLIDAISAPYDLDGHHIVVGTSVGIAIAPVDGTDVDQLLKCAELALYRTKADGRGTFRFFEPEMDARMQQRRATELDLRKALENGEFEVFYQPLVSLQTNQVVCFEALLRWHHPQRGLVAPAEFISLAEEIDLIGTFGAWVLRRACNDAAAWPKHIKVAVNISPVQFKRPTLVLDVIAALGESGLPANRLELEITETAMIEDTQSTLAALHQLRKLGVRIAMDDFGTGYSSLSYLQKFPFDKIKIDQSFVREISSKGQSTAIVRALCGLSGALGIPTTAEGVETEDQLAQLRADGCSEGQGYLFSPPVRKCEIERILSTIAGERRATA